MRAWKVAVVVALFALGSPSCGGRSLDDPCFDSGFTGRQVLAAVPMTMSGSFEYFGTSMSTTTYSLAIRYDGGGVRCNASSTHQTSCGPVTTAASTVVEIVVDFSTADGTFAETNLRGNVTREPMGSPVMTAFITDPKGSAKSTTCAGFSSTSFTITLGGNIGIGGVEVECTSSGSGRSGPFGSFK